MIRTIYADDLEEVKKRLDKLAKKAARYGVPFSYTVGDEHPQEVAVYGVDFINHEQYVDHTYTVSAVDIDVDCEELVKANGWTVIAHIEHGEDGNIVTPIGMTEVDPAWYTAPARCDHCGTKRLRSATFMVEHEDGERRQVGKSCLKDYTGISPAVALMWAEVVGIFPSMEMTVDEWTERRPAVMYDVRTILAHAYDVTKAHGYVKSDARNSTRDAVAELVKTNAEPTPDGMEVADKIIEWLATVGADEVGPERDCKSLAASGFAKHRHIGRLAYMPTAYKRAMERKAKLEARDAANKSARELSKHVGNIGDRVDFVAAAAEFVTSWDTAYGKTFLYKFTDGDGNVFVWFASGAVDEHAGMKVRGTVKKHDVRDGVKQTVITRCKVS